MNSGLKTAIRWLALATLVLFAAACVVGVVLQHRGSVIYDGTCTGPSRCVPPLFAVLSVGSSLALVVVTLCLALYGVLAISAGRRRGWLAAFAILAVLLVLSPTLRWFLPPAVADTAADYVTAGLAVIALLVALVSVLVPAARSSTASSDSGGAGTGGSASQPQYDGDG